MNIGMSVYIYALGSVLVVSLISLIGIFSLSKTLSGKRATRLLVSLAAGALLGDAFIHLIPEAFEKMVNWQVSSLIIVGIILFFILEKILHWHHHHGDHHDEKCRRTGDCQHNTIRPIGRIVLFSDGMHNFVDGLIIGASYLVSIEIGMATTLAVILHEIPQEIGDFGILLHAGYSRARALFVNFLSALMALVGAIVVLILGASEVLVLYMLPIAAGGFIYIAAADIFPELHKTRSPLQSFAQLVVILIGIALMFAILLLE